MAWEPLVELFGLVSQSGDDVNVKNLGFLDLRDSAPLDKSPEDAANGPQLAEVALWSDLVENEEALIR